MQVIQAAALATTRVKSASTVTLNWRGQSIRQKELTTSFQVWGRNPIKGLNHLTPTDGSALAPTKVTIAVNTLPKGVYGTEHVRAPGSIRVYIYEYM